MFYNISKNINHVKRTLIVAFLTLTFIGISACSKQQPSNYSVAHKPLKKLTQISFEPVPLATSRADISNIRVSKSITIHYSDHSHKTFPLEYKKLISSGDKVGSNIFGLIPDINNEPIKLTDNNLLVSNNPDGSSFIQNNSGNYLITHLESKPGTIYKTQFEFSAGNLKVLHSEPIDLSHLNGILNVCASSKTPWQSHLGGEEDYSLNPVYADKASPYFQQCEQQNHRYSGNNINHKKSYFCGYVAKMQRYFRPFNIKPNNGYNGDKFTPYNYGYSIEVAVKDDGTTQSAKHYVTGKYTHELGVVMPDNKTIYLTDDGDAKGLWKFVSDEKIMGFNNHWQGTLFAAKVHQLNAKEGGNFSLSWIKLGHGSDDEIKAEIDKKLKLTDIFDITPINAHQKCPQDYTKIYEDGMVECLKLIPGQEKRAAFLESRKYAAYLGATMEFRKEEGATYNPDKNELYIAMSTIDKSMLDNVKNNETNNDIHLSKNKCGVVYQLKFDKNFNAKSMKSMIKGVPLKPGDKYSDMYGCSPQTIANPDNILYLGSNILLIGEDTPYHLNNMTWAYDTNRGTLTRIASLAVGAEVTGMATAESAQHSFLFMNQQHPFKQKSVDANNKVVHPELYKQATEEQLKGVVGYIKGFPASIFLQ